MKKLKFDWHNLNAKGVLGKLTTAIAKITADPACTDAAAVLAEATTAKTALAAADGEVDRLNEALPPAILQRDSKVEPAKNAYVLLGNYYFAKVKGDPVALAAVGFELVADHASPNPAPSQVQNLGVSIGDAPGEHDTQWNRHPQADYYEAEHAADPNVQTGWVRVQSTTKSKMTTPGLPSGTRRWWRVRAVNSNGPGPWSNPVGCMVP